MRKSNILEEKKLIFTWYFGRRIFRFYEQKGFSSGRAIWFKGYTGRFKYARSIILFKFFGGTKDTLEKQKSYICFEKKYISTRMYYNIAITFFFSASQNKLKYLNRRLLNTH